MPEADTSYRLVGVSQDREDALNRAQRYRDLKYNVQVRKKGGTYSIWAKQSPNSEVATVSRAPNV